MEISELEDKLEDLKDAFSGAIEFPESAFKLDMASRRNDTTRQFKYLHQMCTLHGESFSLSNQLKSIAILEGYLVVCREKNPIGPYLFARTLLELGAFLNDITSRANGIYQKNEKQWKSKGEEFFALLVRARYGTSDPKHVKLLSEAGISKKLLKPINIMGSIDSLKQKKDTQKLAAKYNMLCDFVHHNLSSQVNSSSGFRVGNAAHSSTGGGLIMTKDGPITRYEYPNKIKSQKAIDETVDIIDQSLNLCVNSLNKFPRTPYTEKQLLEITGSRIGMKILNSNT